MSLKFGSGNSKKAKPKIVKQVVKRIRVQPSKSDAGIESLELPFVQPHNYASLCKLIQHFSDIARTLNSIELDERTLGLLVRKRSDLIAILSEQNRIMTADIYMPNVENDSQLILFRPDILAFTIMLALTHLCNTGKHANLAPVHLKQLANLDIINEDMMFTPISSFGLRDIFECIALLQQSWKEIQYRTDLSIYMDALLMRIATLTCDVPKPSDLAGCEAYIEVTGNGPRLSRKFLFDIGWTFIDMFTDVSIAHFFTASLKPVPLEFTKADRNWIKARAKTIERPEVYQTKVMELVLKYYCYPGEFERYIRDHKSERFARTPRYKKIINARGEEGKALTRTLMEMLNSKLPTELLTKSSNLPKACRDEILLICLSHWIQRFMQVNFEKTFVRTSQHCHLNYCELAQLVRAHGYPVIIQTFNYYNVYYEGALYLTNSVAKAFLLFIAFVMRYHKGKILNSSITNMNLNTRDMRTFWTL
jgi:hypothetical protein